MQMYSKTLAYLEKFDNQHEFERMCADILNALTYDDVAPIAPRGGSDGGIDITFTTKSGGKGAASVTLRKDIDVKFKEDFFQRKHGEFDKYILFCTAHLTAYQKQKFSEYCRTTLQAQFVSFDIEALRSLLDSTLRHIRQDYLHLSDRKSASRKSKASWIAEARYFRKEGLFDEALHAIEQAVRIDPNDTDVYYEKGWILLDFSHYDEAFLAFEFGLQFDYQNDDLYTNELYRGKGLALTYLGHNEEALAIYNQTISSQQMRLDRKSTPLGVTSPDYEYLLTLFREKASILCTLERYQEALATYEQAVVMYEQALARYVQVLARSAQNIATYLQAPITYEQAIKSSQADSYTLRYKLDGVICDRGDVFFTLKEYEQAFRLYDLALELHPEGFYPYKTKGYALYCFGRYEEALALIDKAIHINPNDFFLYQLQSQIFYHLKRYEEAHLICEKALQLNSQDAELYNMKGDILHALGHLKEAQQAYKVAKQFSTKKRPEFIQKEFLVTL
jgi:tetratricopeptide (TPR) repeat protein